MFLCRNLFPVGRGFQNSVSRFFSTSNLDCRPSALRMRVDFLIRLSDLDTAAKHARLAALPRTRVYDDEVTDRVNIGRTCNAIIDAMSEAKRYKDALDLFHYFFRESNIKPGSGYFNHIMKYHLEQGCVEEALNLYNRSLANCDSDSIIAKGLVDAGRLDEAITRFKPINLFSSGSDVFKILVQGLLRRGDVEKAKELLGDLKGVNHVYDTGYDDVALVSSEFIEYWFEQGKEEEAMKYYNNFKLRKDTKATTVTTLLDLLLKYGKTCEAWSFANEVFDSEEIMHFEIRSDTLNVMVNECFKMDRFDQAIQTFNKVKASKLRLYKKFECYKNLITRLNECGKLWDAEHFFEELCSESHGLDLVHPDVSIFTTMIDAYVKAGRTKDAIGINNRMVDACLAEVARLACL